MKDNLKEGLKDGLGKEKILDGTIYEGGFKKDKRHGSGKLYISDELIIEAEVRPEDVAFVRYGQKARISVTAYDPSVYGFLDGEVQNIAGNTSEKPDGTKYFPARIITKTKIFDRMVLKSAQGYYVFRNPEEEYLLFSQFPPLLFFYLHLLLGKISKGCGWI